MDYNQFTYYRANPYAKQGYMPPVAHINRHKPDFLTELPMGQSDFKRFGRRIYGNKAQRSNIKQQHLFQSPQRYPNDNRIALNKQYQRNLNTIDIQGASSGTVMSEAVRNKLKAKQQLMRRQQAIQGKKQGIDKLQTFEQEKRRNIALQQYLQQQQIKMNKDRNQSMLSGQSLNDSNYKHDRRYAEAQNYHTKQQREQRVRTPDRHQSERYNNQQIEQNNMPRYQSIDAAHLPRNNPQFSPRSYNKKTGFDRQHPNLSQSFYDNRHYNEAPINRKQIRRNNPTNLSSEGSIYLAGKNLLNH